MPAEKLNAPAIRPDGLQLEEHRHFQEKFWTVERLAWGLFLLLLVLAGLGLAGEGGPLARGTATLPGARLDYPRVVRWEASSDFIIDFGPGAAQRQLLLSPEFAENFVIEDVQPEPEGWQATARGQSLSFAFAAGEPGRVTLLLRSRAPGLNRYGLAVDAGAPALIDILALP